ncbi:hypothetical protein CU044_7578 [Streptomyces sp. L-9-10]|nr:hypothetical protein CU044_7578 [Streptomyces sp. L-9-10]
MAEGRVRYTHPSDDEVAEWRRVVNYAKRHGMEPEGRRIEKVPYDGLGLEFSLAEGPHPNARSQRPGASGPVPVPALDSGEPMSARWEQVDLFDA